MAKKVLTPEQQEIKAMKKEKRSQNWTKCWAIVLALALTAGIAFAGKSIGENNKPEESANGEQNVNAGSDFDTDFDTGFDSDFGSDTDTGSSDDTGAGDAAADTGSDAATDAGSSAGSSSSSGSGSSGSSGSTSTSTAPTAAEVAALINKVTGTAVSSKVGYDWSRDCKVSNVNVGALTSILNGIIGALSSGDDVTSIVGKFLGNGSNKQTVKKGQTLDTMKVTKDDGSQEEIYHGSSYTLKATNLKAEDIQNLKVSGNTYTFNIPDCTYTDNPANTSLSRLTNDVVVKDDVDSEIKAQVGSQVSITSLEANYKSITVQVTVKDDKLVSLGYSFAADAKLGVRVGFSVTGTGNLQTKATYSNFQY